MKLATPSTRKATLMAGSLSICDSSPGQTIPKTWDAAALASMQTPLTDPARTPKHMASGTYEKIPALIFYKTYPLYALGRKPAGYREQLRQADAGSSWGDFRLAPLGPDGPEAPPFVSRYSDEALYALALPYEGSHITVFVDRIQGMRTPDKVLAHVMVHEIAHLLQGFSQHSATRVMKERWTSGDFSGMRWRPLPFTPLDIELIHSGLAQRPVQLQRRVR